MRIFCFLYGIVRRIICILSSAYTCLLHKSPSFAENCQCLDIHLPHAPVLPHHTKSAAVSFYQKLQHLHLFFRSWMKLKKECNKKISQHKNIFFQYVFLKRCIKYRCPFYYPVKAFPPGQNLHIFKYKNIKSTDHDRFFVMVCGLYIQILF